MKRLLPLVAATLLAACSTYAPDRLPAQASVEQATASLGRPTGEYALAAGGKRLEFARGPLGRHTYMLDFDAQGRLAASRQVLVESEFDALRAGMSRDEVLARIGHPSDQRRIGWQDQTVWAWRYEGPFCRWFMVGFGRDGSVADTAYGPDPLCESNMNDRDM